MTGAVRIHVHVQCMCTYTHVCCPHTQNARCTNTSAFHEYLAANRAIEKISSCALGEEPEDTLQALQSSLLSVGEFDEQNYVRYHKALQRAVEEKGQASATHRQTDTYSKTHTHTHTMHTHTHNAHRI